MSSEKKISEQLHEFNKYILNLENIDVHIDYEDHSLLLLNYFLKSHDYFMQTLLYGRETFSLEEVQATLSSKELNEKSNMKASSAGDGHVRKYCPQR